MSVLRGGNDGLNDNGLSSLVVDLSRDSDKHLVNTAIEMMRLDERLATQPSSQFTRVSGTG